jgi:creatinine amidohydrolase/Fe(II)-dependent formamide hydrolase-like protein
MLVHKGILKAAGPGMRARQRREILKLRFDKTASPPDVVPLDLRRLLLPILLEHADGAVKRSGRTWLEFDPRDDPWMNAPDRNSRPRRDRRASGEPASVEQGVLLGEMTWVNAKERLAEVDTALLPVGALEQHGPHLPLDTDAWDAEELCRRVAEACSTPRPLVLPLIPYGVSYHHDSFPGTLSVGPDALAKFVYDVGISAARHGITKLVIVNGHGGNSPTLQLAAQKINRDAHIFTCVDSGETSDTDIDQITDTPNDVHAGEIETSTSLATRPHLVDMSRAQEAVPKFSTQYLDFASKRSVAWYAHTARLSASGVLGDPTKATSEKGERIWRLMVDHLTRFVETLKGLTLEEIYARRL